jgi:hypothetical protein
MIDELVLPRGRLLSSNELVDLANRAAQLGNNKILQFAWLALDDMAPAALDRVVPNRTVKPIKLLEAVIHDLRTRNLLDGNLLANKPAPGMCAWSKKTYGSPDGRRYIDVAYIYANREGYSAQLAIRQDSPGEPLYCTVGYKRPGREVTFIGSVPVQIVDEALAPPPEGLVKYFEHVLQCVIAGRNPGAFD